MTGLVRPLLIMLLVLTEVGLWQWRVLLTGRGARALPAVLGMIGAVLQITAIAQVVAYVHDPLTVAVALGWPGATLERMRLMPFVENGIMSFERSGAGREIDVCTEADAGALTTTLLAKMERAQRR